MRITTKLRERESFTPTENEIAKYITEHPREAVELSLEDFSERLYVSKSTIIRFCKKLGFAGHKELCVKLAKELESFMSDEMNLDTARPFSPGDTASAVAGKTAALAYRGISETYDDLDTEKLWNIAKVIHDRKAVCLYCVDENYMLAADFREKLTAVGIHALMDVHPSGISARNMRQVTDIPALFISYYAREQALLPIARNLSERNVTIFLITGPFKGALSRFANETVETSYYEPVSKYVSFGSQAAMRLMLDIIYGDVFMMDYEKNVAQVNEFFEMKKNIQEQGE